MVAPRAMMANLHHACQQQHAKASQLAQGRSGSVAGECDTISLLLRFN